MAGRRRHTDGDLLYHFKNANALAVGDAVAAWTAPSSDGSAWGWIGGIAERTERAHRQRRRSYEDSAAKGPVMTKAICSELRDCVRSPREVVACLKKGQGGSAQD